METRIVKDTITLEELRALAREQYGDVIKAVVDIAHGIMGVGGELHVDIQSLLIEKEDARGDTTWGINLYLEKTKNEFIEFDSMINLKPIQGNRTRGVGNPDVRDKIKEIVNKLVA